jgi:hypothetical protein
MASEFENLWGYLGGNRRAESGIHPSQCSKNGSGKGEDKTR